MFLKDVIRYEALVIGGGRQIIFVFERYSNFITTLYYLEKKIICNIYDTKMPKLWEALNENGTFSGKRGGK